MKQLYLALSGLIAVSTIACGTIEVNPMNIGGEAEVEDNSVDQRMTTGDADADSSAWVVVNTHVGGF